MLRKLVSVALALSLMAPVGLSSVSAAEVNKGLVERVAPASPSYINGIPENELIQPLSSSGPFFHEYKSNSTPSRVEKFREIVYYTHDNSRSSTPFNMTARVEQTRSVGSEWYGNVSFSKEVKAGILAAVSVEVSGGVKETRSENEALGVSGSMTVPAYKHGKLTFYYAARSTQGTVKLKTWYDSLGSYVYTDVPISAKIHPTILDVHSVGETY